MSGKRDSIIGSRDGAEECLPYLYNIFEEYRGLFGSTQRMYNLQYHYPNNRPF
jgi:hypothetical protein